jgi:hypothetical protein
MDRRREFAEALMEYSPSEESFILLLSSYKEEKASATWNSSLSIRSESFFTFLKA